MRTKTSKIILGTVQFGLEYGINNVSGKPDKRTVFSILDAAFEQQIRLLDTAEAYGDAQEIIGDYHRQSSNRFGIITKFSPTRNDLPEEIRDRVLTNIKTLGVDHLYCYMFHSFADYTAYYDRFREPLFRLREQKMIGRIGVSVYTNQEMEALLASGDIDVIQLPFNLLDNNSKRGALMAKAKEKGVEVHTRSVFLQGLFFRDPSRLHGRLAELKKPLEQIQAISQLAGTGINDLSLNYALQQEHIDRVLIGVDSVEQLRNNIGALRHNLASTTLKDIDGMDIQAAELLNPSNWTA